MKLEDRVKSLAAGLAVVAETAAIFSNKSIFLSTHPWVRYLLGISLSLLFLLLLFLVFYTQLIDCFTRTDEDSWDITTFNYIKEYELNIHLPLFKAKVGSTPAAFRRELI